MSKCVVVGIRTTRKLSDKFQAGKNRYAGMKKGRMTGEKFLNHLLELFDNELKNQKIGAKR